MWTAVSFASFINEAMHELKHIIESLLFVSEEPLTVDKIKSVIESADKKEILTALGELSEEYESRNGGFYLCQVAGGYQLRSQPTYHEYIKRLLQPAPQRLSRAALETLAVVAYRQPVIRADIEHIRGVDCGAMLRQLLERKLLRVLGRKEIPGRPLIYATTKTFLELFELKDLSDLPSPAEIEQMGAIFNPESSEESASHDDEPSPGDEDYPPIADEGTAQIEGGENNQHNSVSDAVSTAAETGEDNSPAAMIPGDQETAQLQLTETAEPQTDKPQTTPQQPDTHERSENLQEPESDDSP